MIQLVTAFLGISGSGKTTFLRKVADLLVFQHLTAGSLIANARQAEGDRDNLRLRDIEENQQLLVSGFASAKDSNMPLVVLDGHAIVDGACGLVAVSPETFAKIGVGSIAHFEAVPRQIGLNRANDASRRRPQLPVAELAAHQDYSLKVASEMAAALSVPFGRFSSADHQEFRNFLLIRGVSGR